MTDLAVAPSTTMTLDPTAPDILAATSDAFFADVDGFFGAMACVWPECPAVQRIRGEYEATANARSESIRDSAREAMISQFHEQFKDYYGRAREKDASIFYELKNIDMLRSVRMADKWEEADEDTRDAIFDWLNRIAAGAELYAFYARVPRKMLRRLTGAAMDVTGAGGGAPTNISGDLISGLMNDIDPQEMRDFAESMMSQPSSMESIIGMVTRMSQQEGVAPAAGQANPMAGIMAMMQNGPAQ